MGNDTSKPGPRVKGGMYVAADKLSYVGGEIVTGNIFLSLEEPTPPASIVFGFKGKEITHWIEIHKSGKSRERREYDGKHSISNFKFPIYGWNVLVNPGSYTIPWSFKLPDHLPGSFFVKQGDDHAGVIYELRAKLFTTDKKKLKAKVGIDIKQVAENVNQNFTFEKNAKISTCCCLSKGSVHIKANFAKDFYTAEEIANVVVDVNNSLSKLRVERFHAKLIRRIRMTGTRTGFTLIHDTKSAFRSEVILDVTADGIPEGIKGDGTSVTDPLLNSKQMMFALDLSSVRDKIVGHFTTKGTIVECVYMLECNAEMDGCCMCCGETPSVSAAMMLYPAEIPVPALPSAPENWNPQVVDQVTVTWETQYERKPTKAYEL